jgi:hypothetical protein
MHLKSKSASLLILGLTALVCSRALFFFIKDPEGPNLLVVTGMAAILYALSLAAYVFNPAVTGLKRLLMTIFVQILLVGSFYFLLS